MPGAADEFEIEIDGPEESGPGAAASGRFEDPFDELDLGEESMFPEDPVVVEATHDHDPAVDDLLEMDPEELVISNPSPGAAATPEPPVSIDPFDVKAIPEGGIPAPVASSGVLAKVTARRGDLKKFRYERDPADRSVLKVVLTFEGNNLKGTAGFRRIGEDTKISISVQMHPSEHLQNAFISELRDKFKAGDSIMVGRSSGQGIRDSAIVARLLDTQAVSESPRNNTNAVLSIVKFSAENAKITGCNLTGVDVDRLTNVYLGAGAVLDDANLRGEKGNICELTNVCFGTGCSARGIEMNEGTVVDHKTTAEKGVDFSGAQGIGRLNVGRSIRIKADLRGVQDFAQFRANKAEAVAANEKRERQSFGERVLDFIPSIARGARFVLTGSGLKDGPLDVISKGLSSDAGIGDKLKLAVLGRFILIRGMSGTMWTKGVARFSSDDELNSRMTKYLAKRSHRPSSQGPAGYDQGDAIIKGLLRNQEVETQVVSRGPNGEPIKLAVPVGGSHYMVESTRAGGAVVTDPSGWRAPFTHSSDPATGQLGGAEYFKARKRPAA